MSSVIRTKYFEIFCTSQALRGDAEQNESRKLESIQRKCVLKDIQCGMQISGCRTFQQIIDQWNLLLQTINEVSNIEWCVK